VGLNDLFSASIFAPILTILTARDLLDRIFTVPGNDRNTERLRSVPVGAYDIGIVLREPWDNTEKSNVSAR
jgi:hypothetical protein